MGCFRGEEKAEGTWFPVGRWGTKPLRPLRRAPSLFKQGNCRQHEKEKTQDRTVCMERHSQHPDCSVSPGLSYWPRRCVGGK